MLGFMINSVINLISSLAAPTIIINTWNFLICSGNAVAGSDPEGHSEVHDVMQHRCPSVWADNYPFLRSSFAFQC